MLSLADKGQGQATRFGPVSVRAPNSQPPTRDAWRFDRQTLIDFDIIDSMSLKPIGPVSPPSISLSSISPLGLGGAAFSTQFNPFPDSESTLPVQSILRRALSLGINLIDTSPYYGNSEIILGRALKIVFEEGWNREGIFICTKVGRVKLDEFDYDKKSVRNSVERSLKRLNVEKLDIVYCHDVEFVTKNEVLNAVEELFKLRDEGKLRYVGISGIFPLPSFFQWF
jgi:D-arabinose 1-dehydrogenase